MPTPSRGKAKAAPAAKKQYKPVYKVWISKSSFWCKGLCMTGGCEDCCFDGCVFPCANIFTWCCILVPSTVYMIFALPWFLTETHFLLPTCTVAVFLITIGFLFCTCCSDPGVIPNRALILAVPGSSERLTAVLGYNVLGEGTPTHEFCKDRNEMVDKKLRKEGYKWCYTCEIIRPPRASHCDLCDQCVMRFDHHCPFVNNCVGQRNYCFFFGFLTCVTVLALIVLPCLFFFFLATISDDGKGTGWGKDALPQEVIYVLAALGILVALTALGFFGLWCYHTFLITQGMTTKEHQKQIKGLDQDPTLCAPRGPRLFETRSLVDLSTFHNALPPAVKNSLGYNDHSDEEVPNTF